MKKSLIALAVLASSGAAMAQSSVSVYGLADVWVGSQKNTTNGVSAGGFNKMASNEGFATSRLGFKGTEDLGGGLKANFQIETNVGFDQPAATSLGNRQAWVGLSGGFGEVQLGRVWTPYDDTRALINDTFNANFASSFNVWEGYFDRTSNGIRYNTPSFSGFSAGVVGFGGNFFGSNISGLFTSGNMVLTATDSSGTVTLRTSTVAALVRSNQGSAISKRARPDSCTNEAWISAASRGSVVLKV